MVKLWSDEQPSELPNSYWIVRAVGRAGRSGAKVLFAGAVSAIFNEPQNHFLRPVLHTLFFCVAAQVLQRLSPGRHLRLHEEVN